MIVLRYLEEGDIQKLEITDSCEEGEKEGILYMNNRQNINIEMQNRYQDDWPDRSLFYNCRMFTEGFIHGQA